MTTPMFHGRSLRHTGPIRIRYGGSLRTVEPGSPEVWVQPDGQPGVVPVGWLVCISLGVSVDQLCDPSCFLVYSSIFEHTVSHRVT